MRPAVLPLLCLLAGAFPSAAQPFRVATWQLHELPAPPAASPAAASAVPVSGAASAAEDQRWLPVVEVLSAAEADVIILYGLRDADAAKRIANQMKPRKYAVALHTAFHHNGPKGPIVGQPITLLSRKDRLAAKTIEWSHTGRIDLPGGFAFATFRHGASIVSVYVAGLPGSLTNGMGAADGLHTARKRNYAAHYLAHHASWLAATYTNPVVATYLTGDINLAPKSPLPDECARILEQAGFRALAAGTAQDKAGRSITNRFDLEYVFDPIFTKGVEFVASRQANRPPPEHSLLTCDLTLKSPASAALKPSGKNAVKLTGTPARPASALPPPASAPAPATRPSVPIESVPALPVPVPVPALAPAASAESRLGAVPAAPELAPARRAAKGSAPSPVPAPAAAPASASASARSTENAGPPVVAAVNPSLSATASIRPWFWPAVSGASLFMVGMVLLTRSRRRRAVDGAESPAGDSVFLEMHAEPEPAGSGRASGGAILSAPLTTTGNAQEALWRRSPESSSRRGEARSRAESSERNVMPQLQRLMRDRVVQWLSRQRAQLLDSQERGTAQVLELQLRLEQIKGQFQKRLLEQQQRIADLDTALRSKERLIKQLLRTRPPGGEG